MSYQSPQPQDFSTLNLLFQTNTMGQNNFGGFNSTNPQTNFGLNLPTPAINTQHQNDG